jgi:hypothetical protein
LRYQNVVGPVVKAIDVVAAGASDDAAIGCGPHRGQQRVTNRPADLRQGARQLVKGSAQPITCT